MILNSLWNRMAEKNQKKTESMKELKFAILIMVNEKPT